LASPVGCCLTDACALRQLKWFVIRLELLCRAHPSHTQSLTTLTTRISIPSNGRTALQAVVRRFLATVTQVQFRRTPCRICGRQIALGQVFCPNFLVYQSAIVSWDSSYYIVTVAESCYGRCQQAKLIPLFGFDFKI
jgi:hypothetical protein